MKRASPRHPNSSKQVDDVPRILGALRKAVRQALMLHKRAGHPVAVWRNDRVEWVPPEEIPAPRKARQ